MRNDCDLFINTGHFGYGSGDETDCTDSHQYIHDLGMQVDNIAVREEYFESLR